MPLARGPHREEGGRGSTALLIAFEMDVATMCDVSTVVASIAENEPMAVLGWTHGLGVCLPVKQAAETLLCALLARRPTF